MAKKLKIYILAALLLCGKAYSQQLDAKTETTFSLNEYVVDSPIVTRPYVAFKTNLLFDAVTIANIELEVPVAQRWSVGGEWIFPWWLWEGEQNCIQVLSGSLEARYWIKPNQKYQSDYNPLAGWFVGLYGGGGLYDLEYQKTGYQGEFYIATGISAGYVHPFSKSLLMEFSVGIGYMNTDFRKYEAKYSEVDNKWHLIRQYNGSQTWIGPTKAKVSLVWYPHFNKKRGGER